MARRAVVTAGTGGIGLETAIGLTKTGYAVTVVGRNAERGAQAVERINAGGGEPARFLQADLAQRLHGSGVSVFGADPGAATQVQATRLADHRRRAQAQREARTTRPRSGWRIQLNSDP